MKPISHSSFAQSSPFLSSKRTLLAFVLTLIGLTVFILALPAKATGEEEIVSSEVEAVAQVDTAPVESSVELEKEVINPTEGLPNKIQATWLTAYRFIKDGDLKSAAPLLVELESLKTRAGFSSLEQVSLLLIRLGVHELYEGQVDDASFFARHALTLSPTSPKVWFYSIPLATKSGEGTSWGNFVTAASLVTQQPHLILELVKVLTYPLLWSLTIALYFVFGCTMLTRIRDASENLARMLPNSLRGYLAPLILASILCVPCLLGPLWAIAIWSLAVYLLLPRKRWIALFGGAVIAMWGFVIPIRENLAIWFADEGVQSMLRVTTGSFGSVDRVRITRLAEERAGDGVVHYTLGQLARGYGDYEAAKKSFEEAEQILGEQPWTRAQLGMIAFLEGDAKTANELFIDAENLGLATAGFKYNFSKVKFDVLDTEGSREYFQAAFQDNPQLIKSLQDRENELGLRSKQGLSEIPLPISKVLASALLPMPQVLALEEAVSEKMMPGLRGFHMAMAGIFIAVLFFFVREDRKGRARMYYPDYTNPFLVKALLRCLPGGGWVLSGSVRTGFMIMALSVFLLLPAFYLPFEAAQLFDAVPGSYRAYSLGVSILMLLTIFTGFQLQEEK